MSTWIFCFKTHAKQPTSPSPKKSQNKTRASSQGISHLKNLRQVPAVALVINPRTQGLLNCHPPRRDGEKLFLHQHRVAGTRREEHPVFLGPQNFLALVKNFDPGVDNLSQVYVGAEVKGAVNFEGVFAKPGVVERVDEEYGGEDVFVEDLW